MPHVHGMLVLRFGKVELVVRFNDVSEFWTRDTCVKVANSVLETKERASLDNWVLLPGCTDVTLIWGTSTSVVSTDCVPGLWLKGTFEIDKKRVLSAAVWVKAESVLFADSVTLA